MDYVDLVICKEDNSLYQAPEFSMLQPDDKVIILYNGQEVVRTIKNVMSISTKSEEYQFIVEMSDQPYPYRIIKKVTYKVFDYKDGDGHEKE